LRVDKDLRDALANVLEDAVARVLVDKRVVALVAVHRPDLEGEKKKWDESKELKDTDRHTFLELFNIFLIFWLPDEAHERPKSGLKNRL
jgi:hypothetical protein